MNIYFLSGASRNEGGLFYAVSGLSQALSRLGLNFRLVSHIDKHTNEDLPVWEPMKVELYHGYGPLLCSARLRRILYASNADVLHVHGIWLDRQWAALQWQKRIGKPIVVSPHGMLDPWAVRNSRWKKKLVGWLFANESLRKATCIHALCQSELESIRAYGLNNPVTVIPNGVELPEIGAQEVGDRRQKSGKRILFLGRIHPKKGLKELIDAWGREHRTMAKEWKLVIAGWDDGGYARGLQDQVAELNVGESVEFVGPKFGPEKDALLRSVDAFILPSFSEGLPMSILEAWSYCLPVIMTDYCNLPEGFENAAAIRVEPNAKSIAEGLARLKSMSATDLNTMGAVARELVERRFTWERTAKDMKAVYEWCLGGDKPTCIVDD